MPPFSHQQLPKSLFTTNDCPNEGDVSLISERLDALALSLRSRDADIAVLLSQVEELQRAREALLMEQKELQGVVSVLRRYPSELVGEMLRAATSAVMGSEERETFASLRCVCRAWRLAAFSTPGLWAGLSLELPEVARVSREGVFPRRIKAWFNRAGDLPLTLDLSSGSNMPMLTSYTVKLIREVFLVAADDRNWAHLRLSVPQGVPESILVPLLTQVLSPPVQPWRNLKSLAIPFIDRQRWPEHDSMGLEAYAPSIDCLELWVADPVPDTMPVSHHQLQYLKIHLIEPSTMRGLGAIISSFPNLHHLALITKHPMERHTHYDDINLVHTNLQGLTLNVSAGEILRYFSFPKLEHLEFGDFMTDPSPGAARAKAEVFTIFFQRSQCSLRALKMHGTRLTDSALNRVLRALPKPEQLEYLTLSTSCFVDLLAYRWHGLREVGESYDPLRLSSIRRIEVYGQEPNFDLDLFIRYLKDTWPEALHYMDSDPPPAPSLLLDLHPAVGSNPIHIRHWDNDAKSREQYRILAAMGVKLRVHWAS